MKPRFLLKLEDHLKKELHILDTHQPKVQEHKLQAYREVFDCFIEAFTTYKPLLTDIKKEYEATIALLKDHIRELEPLKCQLVLVSEQCERTIMSLQEEEKDEISALKQERQILKEALQSMRERQNDLEAQVHHLQKDLATQYLLYREEHDANKLLIAKISSNRFETVKKPEVENEDIFAVKLALKVCREDLSKAQVELNRLQAEYGHVVPHRDWQKVDCAYKETLLKLNALQSDFEQMKNEYDHLLHVHKQVSKRRDSLQKDLDGFREASTPRPQWELCTDAVGGNERWSELFEGQSSQQRLEILLDDLGVKGKTKFFTGLGTGIEVPVYLRYEGQFNNLKLQKADLVRVIKEVMKEKGVEDEQQGQQSSLPEFLHTYLERKHGEKAADWAYSIMEGVRQHLHDDFLCLFNDILTGKVDESVYHGQTELASHLLKVLIQSDTAHTGTLTISEFSNALRKAFPLKQERDIEVLVAASQADLDSGGSISYQRLYMEDSDGRHGDFLTLVKRQHISERHLYITQLRGLLEGKREVTVEELKTALKTIDPSLDSEALELKLCTAFSVPAEELQNEQPLETEAALQRLSVANAYNAGHK
ncbi:translin-associated factor X-interacting protein 1 isoform X2 [Denticeps clupeoides]|nr:translin-associated factor X-interacting protein 1 isoform X2 [Denticeps clupeoides]